MTAEEEACDACNGYQVVSWPHRKSRRPVTVVAACVCTGLDWSDVVREPTPEKIEDAIARMRERVLGKVKSGP